MELLHPMREGRRPRPIGKKGKSNHRWIVGGTRGFVLNPFGLVVAWDGAPATVHDAHFQPRMALLAPQRMVLTDPGFHARAGDPPHLNVCQRGTWHVRMVVDTVLSMLTTVCHFKKVAHRVWADFEARLAFTMAAFNLLAQWYGLEVDDDGFVPLSIAEFSL